MIEKAKSFALERHGDQKYGSQPYVYHLSSVVNVLKEFGYEDPVLLASGWLHDTIEDTDVTKEELSQEFGEKVAQTVENVTNEGGGSWKDKKINTFSKVGSTPESTIVKLADRIANVREGEKNDKYRKEDPFFREYLDNSVAPNMWSEYEKIIQQ